jgi:hypothetical protein
MFFAGLQVPLRFGQAQLNMQEYLAKVERLSSVDLSLRVVRVVQIESNDTQLGDYPGGKFVTASLGVTHGPGMPVHLAGCQVVVAGPPPTGGYGHPGVPLTRVASLVMGRLVQDSPPTATDAVDLTPWYVDGQDGPQLRAPTPSFPLEWQAALVESVVGAMFMALAFPHTVQPNWPNS